MVEQTLSEGAVTLSGSNVSITTDHIDMGSGNSTYTIKTNGKGTRYISLNAPSTSGTYADGDIWYQVS